MEEKLNIILSVVQDIQSDVKGLQSEVKGLQGEVKGLQDDVKGLQGDVRKLDQRMDTLENGMNEQFTTVTDEIHTMKNEIFTVKDEIRIVKNQTAHNSELAPAVEAIRLEVTSATEKLDEVVHSMHRLERMDFRLNRTTDRVDELEAEVAVLSSKLKN
ncbi:hypothetical protein DFP93_10880 [Aneurinibacillus soli]|uniref:Chromosome partition protein Smc n=1 Tax=Aneurinibacillus soli TaxID=1500254 RepID=A0A0U4WCI4_9BACL|nr:hypothetical protein [Aneurinibacillus soli]PYE61506.1 hypothetical protein DFP93_10880 [Aneurinibacillus soli]BAU26539.1 Chromosome partition protein Smc [Aneurinibacillus soli]